MMRIYRCFPVGFAAGIVNDELNKEKLRTSFFEGTEEFQITILSCLPFWMLFLPFLHPTFFPVFRTLAYREKAVKGVLEVLAWPRLLEDLPSAGPSACWNFPPAFSPFLSSIRLKGKTVTVKDPLIGMFPMFLKKIQLRSRISKTVFHVGSTGDYDSHLAGKDGARRRFVFFWMAIWFISFLPCSL